MRRFAAVVLLSLVGRAAAGQASIDEQLQTAQLAYQKSNVEQAKNIFVNVLSSKLQLTNDQRITAYKYLGAYWANQISPTARDSASQYFLAALDYDPFTDLDRTIFVGLDEQNAFGRARAGVFRLGVQLITESKAIDPNSTKPDSSVSFRLTTTRSGRITVSIVGLTDPNKNEVIGSFPTNDGTREVSWNGTINNQRADTGFYELRVEAADNVKSGTQPLVERRRFHIEHFHEKLEQKLPPFKSVESGATDTLRSRYSPLKPYTDGAKGLVFVAGLAALLPTVASIPTGEMSTWKPHYGVGISLGAVAGFGAGWYATRHKDDRRAARENERRRNEWERFNAGVEARNQARLAKTILILRPPTAVGITG